MANTAVQSAVRAAGSQIALAKQIGVTQGAISHWVTGRKQISPATAVRLEAATGIPREEFRPDIFGKRAA